MPKRLSEHGSITGSVDSLEAFHLLGLAGVFKDPDLASSLMGSVAASVTFDASGAIASFEVTGKGHDVESTSDSLSAGMFEQLLSGASATVTIKQVGEPVDIEVPAGKDILP